MQICLRFHFDFAFVGGNFPAAYMKLYYEFIHEIINAVVSRRKQQFQWTKNNFVALDGD